MSRIPRKRTAWLRQALCLCAPSTSLRALSPSTLPFDELRAVSKVELPRALSLPKGLAKGFAPLCLAAILFAGEPSLAGEAAPPAFAKKPTVSKGGDKFSIDFAVNRETDVAVSIEDAGGRVVRHLVAGVLGKNPPAPLKAGALEQALEWDGKDDDGRPAAGGPFKVRVGLGLRADYAGQAFAEKGQSGPNRIEGVMGLAAAPDGRLYFLDRCNGFAWGASKVLVFRRDGSYEKTIKPFPSNTPVEKARAAGAFVNSFGSLNPLKFGYNSLSAYPAGEILHQPAVLADGNLLLAVSGGRLAVLDRDGGLPDDAYTGPVLGAGLRYGPYPVLAASSDGKTVFISGLLQGQGKTASAVFRVAAAERGPAQAWFGDASASGNDQTHLNDARGIAADGKGHLLIADCGNNRVLAVSEKDKSVAGSFEVPSPSWVAAPLKTGAVYVQSGRNVIKFSGWSDAKEVARIELAKQVYESEFGPWRLALDGAAEPPVLWAACGPKLLRYLDQGAKFANPVPANCFPARTFYRPAADPTRREVLCKTMDGPYLARVRILDEATGEVRVVPGSEGKYGVAGIQGQQHRLGPDGSIYYAHYWDWCGISRYDRDGKRKPFESTAKDPHLQGRLPFGYDGTTNWGRDFSVDRKGDVYVKARGPEYHGLMAVHVYGPDGAFKRIALQVVSDGAYGPRVDPKGNMYIMEAVKPEGQLFPEEFKGPVAGFPAARDAADWIYGSVVKFGPEGGAVWFSGDQASPLTYEGWGQQHARPGGSGTYKSIVNLRTTGGALTGTITMKSARLTLPVMSVDTAAHTKLTMRLKNDTDGNQAVMGYITAVPPGGEGGTKTIEIKPNSDYTEYTFDMAEEKGWKGFARSMYLIPSTATKGSFSIDWFRIGGPDSKLVWNFDAEDSQEKKLPATMKKEKVGAYGRADGAELQGALWWKPWFSPLGDMVSWTRAACHCTGADFDVDDFGRTFAPDAGRCRVGVLDTNGNEILSFGAYGNQDGCGPESYVLDPETKVLRARREGDPKGLASPFARPEIALAWVVGVAVTDRHAYVDDIVNKRILRVKLDYAASETCELK